MVSALSSTAVALMTCSILLFAVRDLDGLVVLAGDVFALHENVSAFDEAVG